MIEPGQAVYCSGAGTVKPAFGSWAGSMPVIGLHPPGTRTHGGIVFDLVVGGYVSAPGYGFTPGKIVYISKFGRGSLTSNVGSAKIPQRLGIAARGSALIIHISPGTV